KGPPSGPWVERPPVGPAQWAVRTGPGQGPELAQGRGQGWGPAAACRGPRGRPRRSYAWPAGEKWGRGQVRGRGRAAGPAPDKQVEAGWAEARSVEAGSGPAPWAGGAGGTGWGRRGSGRPPRRTARPAHQPDDGGRRCRRAVRSSDRAR